MRVGIRAMQMEQEAETVGLKAQITTTRHTSKSEYDRWQMTDTSEIVRRLHPFVIQSTANKGDLY